MLEKNFTPATLEQYHYDRSERLGAFAADVNSDKLPFVIMMPPPNVTGSLHIGHALTFTLQDILCRFQRMRGHNVLWQAGTDHAGIATQMVVERELAKDGITRQELGREKFLEKVWEWKAQSGGTIISQLRRLGASADWARERFTMDEGLSAAVRKVFVQLFRDGVIYKNEGLVNWDIKLQTAISDLEVMQKEVQGFYYHIRYPFMDGSGYIVVATTRPETLFGDVAVAVHPTNEKYAKFYGNGDVLRIPLTTRSIPIIIDDYADPEKGTGAVKITPAHDFNDFIVGRRHNFIPLNIINKDGTLNAEVPQDFQGLDRLEARKKIVECLEKEGLLEKIEPTTHTVPYGDRSDTVIEPYLTEQWYVMNTQALAAPAIQAVRENLTQFFPENWKKTYFQWLENIQPWCISRQLWWGHRIPAWYQEDGSFYVAETEEEAQNLAGAGVKLTQDPDVLDTWFSSALWPFSTLGWPEKTPELEKFYPTSTLVTGFDIIFFWVARMMMMGIYFRASDFGFANKILLQQPLSKEELEKVIPFKNVYIHALVRDEFGQKMSKSKGNVIDPLKVIDEYGCDAMRFTLAILAAQGRDVKLAMSRVEGYRNFATKLWNASRYAEMNGAVLAADYQPDACQHVLNQWILVELQTTATAVADALDAYTFNEAAERVYHFVWGTFCDWYLEFTKPLLQSNDARIVTETKQTIAFVLAEIVKNLHPFMPFITDELAEKLGFSDKPLLFSEWTNLTLPEHFTAKAQNVSILQQIITEIRSAKVEMHVPAATPCDAVVIGAMPVQQAILNENSVLLQKMARLKTLVFSDVAPPQSVQLVIDGMTIALPLGGMIDIDQEKQRLAKELKALEADIARVENKLNNPQFVAKASAEVVAEQQQKREGFIVTKNKLEQSLQRLQAA